MTRDEPFQTSSGALGLLSQTTLFTVTTLYPHIWPAGTRYQTFGPKLLDTSYSISLMELVHRCLAYDPNDRPTAQELALEIEAKLNNDHPLQQHPLFDHLGNINPQEPFSRGVVGAALIHTGVPPPLVGRGINPPATGNYCQVLPPTASAPQPPVGAPLNPYLPPPPPATPPSIWNNIMGLVRTFAAWPWTPVAGPPPPNTLPPARMQSTRARRPPQRYGQ